MKTSQMIQEKNKIAILCTTKKRKQRLLDVYNSLVLNQENNNNYDFYSVIDENDRSYDDILDITKIYVDNKKSGLVYPTNQAFLKLEKKYLGYMLIGDDCIVKTKNWDKILINLLKKKEWCIAYTNDLLRRECLPINFVISYKLAEQLNFLAYPKLRHMFVDTYWRELGEYLDCLYYLPNVIIEHMHYTNNKANIDETYKSTADSWDEDNRVYLEWKKNGIETTIPSELIKKGNDDEILY